jgi:endonuclease YncB( thermonuclease family)
VRQAHRVWSGIATVVFAVVAVTDLSNSSSPTTTSSASTTVPPTASSAPPTSEPVTEQSRATEAVKSAGAASETASGEVVTVTAVIDGDTLEVAGGRKIQILAIDACEPGTYGGDQATEYARTMLEGESVTLTSVPGVSQDRRGNDLRIVVTSSGGDVGESAVRREYTAVYEGHGAPAEYLSTLRAAEDGPQRCAAPAPTGGGEDGGSIDWPSPGDQGLPDGALTGGYCRKKWWC